MRSTQSYPKSKPNKKKEELRQRFIHLDCEGGNQLNSYKIQQYIREDFQIDLPDYIVKQIISDKVLGNDKVHVRLQDFQAIKTFMEKKKDEYLKLYGFSNIEELGVYKQEKEYQERLHLIPFPQLKTVPQPSSIQIVHKISGLPFQTVINKSLTDSLIVLENYLKPLDKSLLPTDYFQSQRFRNLQIELSTYQNILTSPERIDNHYATFTPLFDKCTLRQTDQCIFEFLSANDKLVLPPLGTEDQPPHLTLFKFTLNKFSFPQGPDDSLLLMFFLYDKVQSVRITEEYGISIVDGIIQQTNILFEVPSHILKNVMVVCRVTRDGTKPTPTLTNALNKSEEKLDRSSFSEKSFRSTMYKSTDVRNIKESVDLRNDDKDSVAPYHVLAIGFAHLKIKKDIREFQGTFVSGESWNDLSRTFIEDNKLKNSEGHFEGDISIIKDDVEKKLKIYDRCRNLRHKGENGDAYMIEFLRKRFHPQTPMTMYGDSLFLYITDVVFGKDHRRCGFSYKIRFIDADHKLANSAVFYPREFSKPMESIATSAVYHSLRNVHLEEEVKIKLPTPILESYYLEITLTEFTIGARGGEKTRYAILPLYNEKMPLGDGEINLRLSSTPPKIKLPLVLDKTDKGSYITVKLQSLATGYPSNISLSDYFTIKDHPDSLSLLDDVSTSEINEYLVPILNKELTINDKISNDKIKSVKFLQFLQKHCPIKQSILKPYALQKYVYSFNPFISDPLQLALRLLRIIQNGINNGGSAVFELMWFFFQMIEKCIIAYLQIKRAGRIEETQIFNSSLCSEIEKEIGLIGSLMGDFLYLNVNSLNTLLTNILTANYYYAEFLLSLLHLWRIGVVAKLMEDYLNSISPPLTSRTHPEYERIPFILRFDFLSVFRDYDYLNQKDCPQPLLFTETAELPDIMQNKHFFHGLLIRQYISLIVTEIKREKNINLSPDKSTVDDDLSEFKRSIIKMAIFSIGSLIQRYDTMKQYSKEKAMIAPMLFPLVTLAIEEKNWFKSNSNVRYDLLQKDIKKYETNDHELVYVWKVFYSSIMWVLKHVDASTLTLYFRKEVTTQLCDLLFHFTNAIRFSCIPSNELFKVNMCYDNTRYSFCYSFNKTENALQINRSLFHRRGTLDTSADMGITREKHQRSLIERRKTTVDMDALDLDRDTVNASNHTDKVTHRKKVGKKNVQTLTMKLASGVGSGLSAVGKGVFSGVTNVVKTVGWRKKGEEDVNSSELTTEASEDTKKSNEEKSIIAILLQFHLRGILKVVMDCFDVVLAERTVNMSERDVTQNEEEDAQSELEQALHTLLNAIVLETPISGIVTLVVVDFVFTIITSHYDALLNSRLLSVCILKALLKMCNCDEQLLRGCAIRMLYLFFKAEYVSTSKTSFTSSTISGIIAKWESRDVRKFEATFDLLPSLTNEMTVLHQTSFQWLLKYSQQQYITSINYPIHSQALNRGLSAAMLSDISGFLRQLLSYSQSLLLKIQSLDNTLTSSQTSIKPQLYVMLEQSILFHEKDLQGLIAWVNSRFIAPLHPTILSTIVSTSQEFMTFLANLHNESDAAQTISNQQVHLNKYCNEAREIGFQIFNWASESSKLPLGFTFSSDDESMAQTLAKVSSVICSKHIESSTLLTKYEKLNKKINGQNPLFPIEVEELKQLVRAVISLYDEQINRITSALDARKNSEQIQNQTASITSSLANDDVSVKLFDLRARELSTVNDSIKRIRTRTATGKKNNEDTIVFSWEAQYMYWEVIIAKMISILEVLDELQLRVQENDKLREIAVTWSEKQEIFAKNTFQILSETMPNENAFEQLKRMYNELSDIACESNSLERSMIMRRTNSHIDLFEANIENAQRKMGIKYCKMKQPIGYDCYLELLDMFKAKNEKKDIEKGTNQLDVEETLQEHNSLINSNEIKEFLQDLINEREKEIERDTKRKAFAVTVEKLYDLYENGVTKQNYMVGNELFEVIESDCNSNIPDLMRYYQVKKVKKGLRSTTAVNYHGNKLNPSDIKEIQEIPPPNQQETEIQEVKPYQQHQLKPSTTTHQLIHVHQATPVSLPKTQTKDNKEDVNEVEKGVEKEMSIFLDQNGAFRVTSVVDLSKFMSNQFNKTLEFQGHSNLSMIKDILKRQKELWKYESKRGDTNEIKDEDILLESYIRNAQDYVSSPHLYLTWIKKAADIHRNHNRNVVAGICEVASTDINYCDPTSILTLFGDFLQTPNVSIISDHSCCTLRVMLEHAWKAVSDFGKSEAWFAHEICAFLKPYYTARGDNNQLSQVHAKMKESCEKMSQGSSASYYYRVGFILNGKKQQDFIYSSLLPPLEFTLEIKQLPIAKRAKIVSYENEVDGERIVIQQVFQYINQEVVRSQPVQLIPTNQFAFECDSSTTNSSSGHSLTYSLSFLSKPTDIDHFSIQSIGLFRVIFETQRKLPTGARRILVKRKRKTILNPVKKATDVVEKLISNLQSQLDVVNDHDANTLEFSLIGALYKNKWNLPDVTKVFLIDQITSVKPPDFQDYVCLKDTLKRVDPICKKAVDKYITNTDFLKDIDENDKEKDELTRIKKRYLLFTKRLAIADDNIARKLQLDE
ncbi:DOCKER domain-containing protein [Entamoeba marina]